jgi:hypothetical protein
VNEILEICEETHREARHEDVASTEASNSKRREKNTGRQASFYKISTAGTPKDPAAFEKQQQEGQDRTQTADPPTSDGAIELDLRSPSTSTSSSGKEEYTWGLAAGRERERKKEASTREYSIAAPAQSMMY